MQADRKLLFAEQHKQHEYAGSELGEHRRGGGSRDIHVKAKHEERVQDDVQNGADQRGGHAKSRKALGGDKIIHAGGKQGKKSSAGVNSQIGVSIGKCSLAGTEPDQKLILGQQKQKGQSYGKEQQDAEAVPENPAGLLSVFLAHPHREQNGAADAYQSTEGGKQRDDRGADPGSRQRDFSDFRNISYINTVNDTVQNVDELCKHKRDGDSEHQRGDRIVSKVVYMFFQMFHKSGHLLKECVPCTRPSIGALK